MKRNMIKAISISFALCLILAHSASTQDQKQMLKQKVAAFKQARQKTRSAPPVRLDRKHSAEPEG